MILGHTDNVIAGDGTDTVTDAGVCETCDPALDGGVRYGSLEGSYTCDAVYVDTLCYKGGWEHGDGAWHPPGTSHLCLLRPCPALGIRCLA